MKTINEMTKDLNIRINEVVRDFIESGKCIDFHCEKYVDAVTCDHFKDLVDKDNEVVVDIEDNCPYVYYERGLGSEARAAYCVGAYIDNNRLNLIVWDVEFCDFDVVLPIEITMGYESVVGMIETIMNKENNTNQ
jgi:hypothetical protein